MKRIFLGALLLLCYIYTPTVRSQQNLKVETAIMNCTYNALPDNGKSFKAILAQAEEKLIKANILKNSKGESYTALYQNTETLLNPAYRDLGVIARLNLEYKKMVATNDYNKCVENVIASPEYKTSKIYALMQFVQSKGNDFTDDDDILKMLQKLLKPEDFEHDYYKMFLFTMLETINYADHELLPEDLEIETENTTYTAEELANAFTISIEAFDKVYYNNKEISTTELQSKLKQYLQKNKATALVKINTSLESEYGFYVKIQNMVKAQYDHLRNELSLHKFNKDFTQLSPKQQEEIKAIYPLRITE